MTTEEKAKRYDEALEVCRKLYNEANANEYVSDMEDYEQIFPELKESEDEKTRKRIIALVNAHDQGMYKDDMLTWLEKQGEQKPDWSEGDDVLLSSVINSLLIIEDSGASKMKIDWLISLKQRLKE